MQEHNIASRTDYFTLGDTANNYSHFSVETPFASPTFSPGDDTLAYIEHPLLASRESAILSPPTEPPMASNFMSRQTAAAHGQLGGRPRPYPVQNVLHVTSDDSTSSAESSSKSSISSTVSSPELARCSRCQRTPSIDVQTGKSNMISYGLNLWYCSRCAALVGLTQR
ncbi:uncharacterized protein MYCFIDRAFT_181511 [Pseudocercospora fijiensis CIRAD86]|uniref:Uncharacterized protein n=1 Tax=Pseudocercospora fijiensis (strain CIRAD86) TaxID=383855 RepID=N1QCI1_PSEFD|nr:uncharacterized protein MYCFIDRAFT_181511 [Pseudocercospora fijiensis CIRAD86]EME89337.1 hypothetical protein MYCFIDRAFT_181511 [Pseudocercospora fijiensis CIRAD86]